MIHPGYRTKFELGASAIDTLAHKAAEEAGAPQIKREQAKSLNVKLPDFRLPSFMPMAGAPRSFGELRVRSTCRGGNPTRTLTYVMYDVLVSRVGEG
jgi:nitric oxide synthase-interacting protein